MAFRSRPSAFSESFESAEQTVTPGGSLTLAHGLSAEPSHIQAFMVCKTAEDGYSIGDKVLLGMCSGTTAARGVSLVPDSTNINVRFGSSATACTEVLNKSTGATAGLINGNWKLVVRAFV